MRRRKSRVAPRDRCHLLPHVHGRPETTRTGRRACSRRRRQCPPDSLSSRSGSPGSGHRRGENARGDHARRRIDVLRDANVPAEPKIAPSGHQVRPHARSLRAPPADVLGASREQQRRRSENSPRAVLSPPTLAIDTCATAGVPPACLSAGGVHLCGHIRRFLMTCSRTHATSWCAAPRARSGAGGSVSVAPPRVLSGMVRLVLCG